MIKALFLAPGRLAAKLFSKEKRRQYRSARQRSTVGPGTVVLSLAIWLALIGAGIVIADKVGLLNKALNVGVEAANSGDKTDAGTEDGPMTSGGWAAVGQQNQPESAPSLPAGQTAATQTKVGVQIQKAEMWLVILNTIPKSSRDEAERLQIQYRNRGLEVDIMDTDNYPLLKSGFWIIAQGPFDDQSGALSAASIAKSFKPDLMVRKGL